MNESDAYWDRACTEFKTRNACRACLHGPRPCGNSEEAGSGDSCISSNGSCYVFECRMNEDGKCTHAQHPSNARLEDLVLEDL